MIWKNSRYIWLGAAVAIVQSGALYAMVAQRASILRSGTNITLLTEPVDPNDFLRGDYVSLGYGISTVEAGKVGGTPPAAAGPTDIYVTVKPGDDRVWTLSEASWQRREDVPDGQIQLRGRTTHSMNTPASSQLRITYGIERYYVPEGHGLVIENQQRERKIEAVIAVSPDGEAQIRALKNDGEIMYEEPIY
ncbi:GDYXXLXY domain-containing protein [Phyllobacterium lublinensis]|uniref:GDYXXLXY domain-containing protein n=1 Tax=Phyllobacterium lublinensis TaxID=2875708 RepID=UPI001CCEBCA4|nr:GDYXXLXY domain-containing protein [Phyllobacterium sp. 2063]MBZ9653616.1 GDYXXLXY domain-containing protein [Phyllobacterium sp. 2063]